MKVVRGINNLQQYIKECVITIGNFDGFHLGHQVLIKELEKFAINLQVPSVLMTFEPQPNEFFNLHNPAPRLMRFREKCEWLQTSTIDYLLCVRFDKTFADLNADDFINELLIKKLNIRAIVIGDDFHFGAKKQGDYHLLEHYSQRYGFVVSRCHALQIDNQRVSSTNVRNALYSGDFFLVQKLLGRPYFLSGKVCYGNRLGRELGFPTANVYLHRRQVPLNGIYAVRVNGLETAPINGVAYVGTRPIIGGTRVLLEVHLLDFNRDIYGKHIDVEFLQKIRDDQHFTSLADMVVQIRKDITAAENFFSLQQLS